MANQNLSQFTEKLFVADADHTFIWDTANAISKRVSRNSWLNSGTLTSDAPVTISQTWNNAAVAFTGLKVNAVSTASASGSLLADFQLGGASRVTINKSGETRLWKNSTDYTYLLPSGEIYGYLNSVGVATRLRFDDGGGAGSGAGLFLGNTGIVGWHSLLRTDTTTPDTILLRDGYPNTLALRNGANAQTFNVYNTYYNAGLDYERGTFDWKGTANVLRIGTEKFGGGQARSVDVISTGQIFLTTGPGSSIDFRPAGITRWNIHTPGNLWATTDNAYDIGASGANRPRNIYVGTSIVVGASDGVAGSITVGIGASKGIIFGNRGQIGAVGDGVFGFVDFAGSSFSRLQLGPNTDSAPAIARDGAGIKFTGAAAGSTSWIKVPPVAVGSLPVAATAGAGARAFVNDASAPVFGTAVAGGGAVLVPVYCTGSAWNVG
jgi:hypothetical protein